jgi:hypothetical protein
VKGAADERPTAGLPQPARVPERVGSEKADTWRRREFLGEERLKEDLGDDGEGMLGLTAAADPIQAEPWDNRKDAAYDRL